MSALYLPRDDGSLDATVFCRGPWDRRAQHGGPPSALIARALETAGEDPVAWQIARLSLELLRPVPLGRMTVEVNARKRGVTVQRWAASLAVDGTEVMTATALRLRKREVTPSAPHADAPWPGPDTLDDLTLSFFPWDEGYHQAVQLKVAHGTWGTTPIGVWGRPRVALVAGEDITPLQALMVLADAQSGIGVPLDPLRYTFVNPDLTVYLERPPSGTWFGLDIRSSAAKEGMGLAQAAIRDHRGVMARSAQTLVVAKRR